MGRAETSCPHPEAGPAQVTALLHPQPQDISCLTGQKPQMDTMVAHGLHGLRTVVLAVATSLPFLSATEERGLWRSWR